MNLSTVFTGAAGGFVSPAGAPAGILAGAAGAVATGLCESWPINSVRCCFLSSLATASFLALYFL